MKIQNVLIALAACAASACHLSNPSGRLIHDEDAEFPPLPDTVKLDESLVPHDPPGTIRIVDDSLRQVDGVSSGRVWLLELYNGALAEKEALTLRLAESEREREESAQARSALTAERDQLAARCAELDQRVRELEAQSLDLAQRLAESEIARLELQKAALERESRISRKERP